MQHIAEVFAAMSALEITSVVFAVAYLLLVIKENAWCWPAALVSVLLSLVLFYEARLYMESVLQIFYAGMAAYGWYQWRYGGGRHEGVAIQIWSWRRHAVTIAGIVVLSAAFGFMLRNTNAALPFLDSFTTVAAVVTTYMVAKKVLENWVYWFVIDSVSVYLYGSRGLFLYAALFVCYLVLIVVGFRAWTRQWQSEQTGVEVASGGY